MTRRAAPGMTVLELMIVLAIIAMASLLVRSGFRMLTRADLVENSTDLAAVLRRTSQLSVETGELHRVVLDLDKQGYAVEVCEGATGIERNAKVKVDDKAKAEALRKGQDKLQSMGSDAMQLQDPEAVEKRALAIAGHHVADRECKPVTDGITGDATGKGWARPLRVKRGIKFKEVWVQHRDDSVTKGQVAIYFFPMGSSEKSVIELTDGSETFTVLVYGLTGGVELRAGELRDVNDHMLRNVMGEKDTARDGITAQ